MKVKTFVNELGSYTIFIDDCEFLEIDDFPGFG